MLSADVTSLLPWHKSLIIRFAFQDLIDGKPERSIAWLEANYTTLGDDLRSLLRSLKQYLAGEDLDVGESGTLLRFWRYFLLVQGDPRMMHVRGTLRRRPVYSNPDVIDMGGDELLLLDGGTSQWASIAALMGRIQKPQRVPGHLQLTYDAIQLWNEAQIDGVMWPARKDHIISEMVEAWLNWRHTGDMRLVVDNAEKALFAERFGLITAREAEWRFPQLVGHESDRIKAMRRYRRWWWIIVGSRDHRVVQALAMSGKRCIYLHRRCVSKSWPQFWPFMAIYG